MQQLPDSPVRQHRPRAKRGTISRDMVVSAALAEVAAGRYRQLTVRSLAARLGVAPMSLYRHIRDKDDLLDAVVDRMLAEVWEPAADPDDAWAWVFEAADRLRAFLVGEPVALQAILAHPLTSPAVTTRLHAMLGVMQRAGLSEDEARRLFANVHTYTLGFAALEASRARWHAEHQEITDAETAWLATLHAPAQFAAGLHVLLGAALTPPAGSGGA
jgi:TetR/AcrR family transcriptional regulator, tetracycline repressor protein